MAKKYLLTNIYNFYNKGEIVALTSLIENLPDSEFTIAPFYSYVKSDICNQLGIKIVGRTRPLFKYLLFPWAVLFLFRLILWSLIHELLRFHPNFLLNRELRAYLGCDVVIDLGGDTFTDDPNSTYSLVHCFSLLPAILFAKPYVICSQSIGPFNNFFTRGLAKFVINRAHLVTVREKITENYLLSDLKINNNHVFFAPDLAFLQEIEEVKSGENGRIVGVNPSQIISQWMFPECKDAREKSEKYLNLMATIISEIAAKDKIILVPHVTGPAQSIGTVKNPDDRIVSGQIHAKLKNQLKIDILEEDYDHIYTKELISQFHLFIGCRMHACIGAVSTGVPTVALAYSHKTTGIAELISVSWFAAVDVRNKSYQELLQEITQKIIDVQQHGKGKNNALREINMLKESARMHINLIQNLHGTKAKE